MSNTVDEPVGSWEEKEGDLHEDALLMIERRLCRGKSCPPCGRDNHEYGNMCTSIYCDGVLAVFILHKKFGPYTSLMSQSNYNKKGK